MAKRAANPYWVKRSEFDMIQVERTAESVAARLEVAYSNSVSDLQKELDAFFGKYAKDNEITFAQAKERLNPQQLKSYRQEHDRYIRKAEKYGNDLKDLLKGSPEYKRLEKELKELSSRAYVTKLDELIGKTKMQINLTGLEETNEMYKSISQQYLDSYYKEVFNMSDIVQSDFAAPSMKVAKKAATQKWYSKQNFRDSIWKNKEKLTRELEQLLPRTFITDSKKQSASEIISERMGVSLSNAKRLIKTEMSHIANQACLDSYKDMEVEQFQFLATLDSKTSEACRSLDYEVFDLKDAEVGVNVPPIHPYCRSTTIPYFEPDDLDISIGEGRAARNEEGKTVTVSNKLNYKQWAEIAAPSLLKPKKEEAVQKPLGRLEASQQAYDVRGIKKPKRPSFRDYPGGVTDENFIRDRAAYNRDKEVYDELMNQQVDQALKREFNYDTPEKVLAAGRERGIEIDPRLLNGENDLRAFDELFESYDELREKYPQVMKYEYYYEDRKISAGVNRIMKGDGDRSRWFYAAFGGGDLVLGDGMLKSYEGNMRKYLESITEGYFSQGTGTYKNLFNHEFGHNMDTYIQKMISSGKESPQYSPILAEYQNGLRKIYIDYGPPSEYGGADLGEFFAETFSAYEGGEQTDLTRAFGKFLEGWL